MNNQSQDSDREKNKENNDILKQAPDAIKQNCFKEYFRMDRVKIIKLKKI